MAGRVTAGREVAIRAERIPGTLAAPRGSWQCFPGCRSGAFADEIVKVRPLRRAKKAGALTRTEWAYSPRGEMIQSLSEHRHGALFQL